MKPERRAPRASLLFFFEVASVAAGKISGIAAFLITNIIIARFLGPEGKGLTSIFTVIPHLVVAVAAVGMDKSSAYMIGKRLHAPDAVLTSALIATIPLSLLGAGVAAGYLALTWHDGYTVTLVALTALITLFSVVQQIMGGVMLGNRMIGVYSHITAMPPLVQAAWLAVLAATAAVAVQDVVVAMLAGWAAAVAYSCLRLGLSLRFRLTPDRACLASMLGYGAVASVGDFLVLLNYKIHIFVLQFTSTVEQVGLFTLGQNFGEMVWLVPSILSSVILSRSANAPDAAEFSAKIGVLLRVSLSFCVLGAAAGGAVCWVAIPLVFGEAFRDSAAVLLVLLPGVVAVVSYRILSFDLVGQGKARLAALVIAPSIVLNVLLGAALAPAYGAMGSAVAASVTYLALSAAIIVLYCRQAGVGVGAFLLPRRSDFAFLMARLPRLRGGADPGA